MLDIVYTEAPEPVRLRGRPRQVRDLNIERMRKYQSQSAKLWFKDPDVRRWYASLDAEEKFAIAEAMGFDPDFLILMH